MRDRGRHEKMRWEVKIRKGGQEYELENEKQKRQTEKKSEEKCGVVRKKGNDRRARMGKKMRSLAEYSKDSLTAFRHFPGA